MIGVDNMRCINKSDWKIGIKVEAVMFQKNRQRILIISRNTMHGFGVGDEMTFVYYKKRE